MVQADQARNGGRYRSALTTAFVERSMLSVPAALALADAPVPQAVAVQPGPMGMAAGAVGSQIAYAYDDTAEDEGYRLGFGKTPELPLRATSLGSETFDVHAPDESPRFAVAPAEITSVPQGILSPEDASRHFVEDLLQLRRINIGTRMGAMAELSSEDPTRYTHVLVTDSKGARVLKRDHFDCGFCQSRIGRSRSHCA